MFALLSINMHECARSWTANARLPLPPSAAPPCRPLSSLCSLALALAFLVCTPPVLYPLRPLKRQHRRIAVDHNESDCNVATALSLQSQCVEGAVNANIADPGIQAAAASASQLDNIPFTPSAAALAADAPAAVATTAAAAPASPPSIASLAATQSSKLSVFEACSADSACQQGCCGFSSGKCAGPNVAQTNGSGGCGHGNAAPNCESPRSSATRRRALALDNLPFTSSK
ncbi:hypothetical protein K438DRAFT_1986751 [Mycena galopus ATCC 62051]|nr:hypothetical protein K438DRAFT_1986751 [Mycena galopus ATCC 62051]